MSSWYKFFLRQVKREWILKMRYPQAFLNPFLLFFSLVLFAPMALPADQKILQDIFPEIIWSSLLFSLFLATDSLFQNEYESGLLEQWKISGNNLMHYLYPKLLINFLLIVTPIILLSPFIGAVFVLSNPTMLTIDLIIIISAISLLLLCALVQSFGIVLKQKGLLMALLLMPLSIPVMIFSTLAMSSAISSENISGYLALLLAIDLLAIFFMPKAIVAILKLDLY